MLVIGCVSQKGGVGKSTVARDLARQFALSGWSVKIADLDTAQTTSVDWSALRMEKSIQPEVQAEAVTNIPRAIAQSAAAGFQMLVFDGKPHSNKETLQVAEASDLVVIPTGTTVDDLRPQVRLALELKQRGFDKSRVVFLLNNVASDLKGLEVDEARQYIELAGFEAISQAIPKRQAYQLAQNTGHSISETTFPTLRTIAESAIGEIAERITMKQEVA